MTDTPTLLREYREREVYAQLREERAREARRKGRARWLRLAWFAFVVLVFWLDQSGALNRWAGGR